jgi:hypothetical protein
MRRRWRAVKLRRACQRKERQFFIMWASSKMRYFHLRRLNILTSCKGKEWTWHLLAARGPLLRNSKNGTPKMVLCLLGCF